MRILVYILLIIVSNVYSTLYRNGDQDRQNDYPDNIDYPSILHKYDFDDPDVVFNPRQPHEGFRETSDDIDYEAYELNEGYRDFQRGLPDWFLRSDDEETGVTSDYQKDSVCHTEACHKAAREIKNSMDPSIDPCQDFDKFACGGWRARNPIPKSHSQWTVFSKLWQDEEAILKRLIERQADSPANSSASLVYAWYSSCMNEKEIKKLGAEPLFKIIEEHGSCPLVNPWWESSKWSFLKHLVSLNRISIHPFFLVTPSNALFNSSRILLQVGPTHLLLRSVRIYLQPGKYYTEVRRAYVRMMIVLMSKLSPAFLGYRSFLIKIANLFKLELYLAKAQLNPGRMKYARMTLKQLERVIPEFPWRKYIKILYSKVPQKKPITGDEMIGVRNIIVLKRIARILRSTPKKILANYFIWNIVYRFTNDLSPDFDAIRHKFVVAMYGAQKRQPRWRECVASTSSALSMAVGKLFVEEKFNKESKVKAEKIIEDIRRQLLKDFEKLKWMDPSTTYNAEKKANAIVKNVGYPKFVLNETLVRNYYHGMSFNPRTFLENIIKRRRVISLNTLRSRESKPNRGRWSMSPQQINAYYSLNYNKIVFPAAILQPPFWHASYPMSMQYGGLGFIVGHEITHGFDAHGMHYDKRGNYHGWWTNNSMHAFKSKSRCLGDQYSHYKLFGKHINGNLTLSENIADNAGIRLAYKAYKEWLKKNGAEKKLPGLPFSSDQLFFLKGAQIWCSNIRRKSTLHSLDTDVHSPKIYRIIGSFSNCVDFSKAFNCSSESRMNPLKKCSVW